MNRKTETTHSFNEFCKQLGKNPLYVRSLQADLNLHIPSKLDGYSASYGVFMRKVVSLRTFSIPVDMIGDCLTKEIKILTLLHMDTLSTSPTWYLDACLDLSGGANKLLLTGYDLGFPVSDGAIQCNLDFGRRDTELFEGREMGEDVRRVLRNYVKLVDDIKKRAYTEMSVLENALVWLEQAF